MFDGREGAIKIEQVWRKEKFWSFFDINNEYPPFVYHLEKQKSKHQIFQYLFKANLNILTNTSTPGQYTNSSTYTMSFRVTIRRSVASTH